MEKIIPYHEFAEDMKGRFVKFDIFFYKLLEKGIMSKGDINDFMSQKIDSAKDYKAYYTKKYPPKEEA